MAVVTLSAILFTIGKEILMEVLIDKLIDAGLNAYNNFQVDAAIAELDAERESTLKELSREFTNLTQGTGFEAILEDVVQDVINSEVRKTDTSLGAHITRKDIRAALRSDRNFVESVRAQVAQIARDEGASILAQYAQRREELSGSYANLLANT